jgi:hypothetical protein
MFVPSDLLNRGFAVVAVVSVDFLWVATPCPANRVGWGMEPGVTLHLPDPGIHL